MPCFHRRIRSLTMRQRLTLLLTCSMRQPAIVQGLVGHLLLPASAPAPGFLGRHEDLYLGQRERQEAQILQQLTPRRQGIGVASAMRFSWTRPPWVSLRKRMVSGALTSRIFFTVWSFSCRYNTPSVQQGLGGGRCAVPCRHGQKGGRGTAAGPAIRALVSSPSGVTTVAASASETPSRCARVLRERAGTSPRVRSAASSAGNRT